MRTVPENVLRVALVRPAGESSSLVGAAYRALDLGVAVLALVVLAPVMLILALAIRIESRGPAIVRTTRLGLDLEPFGMHVFRTAYQRGPFASRPTRTGRAMRALGLDALPELWDVVIGRMSLVGPHPSEPFDVPLYDSPGCSQHWFLRFAVKPGLTGLAQISPDRDRSLARTVSLDVDYVCRRSLSLNLQILARAVAKALDPRRTA